VLDQSFPPTDTHSMPRCHGSGYKGFHRLITFYFEKSFFSEELTAEQYILLPTDRPGQPLGISAFYNLWWPCDV
jgi:hypothetical protein